MDILINFFRKYCNKQILIFEFSLIYLDKTIQLIIIIFLLTNIVIIIIMIMTIKNHLLSIIPHLICPIHS